MKLIDKFRLYDVTTKFFYETTKFWILILHTMYERGHIIQKLCPFELKF